MKDQQQRTPWPFEQRRGLRIYRHALEQGALIRPLGTTVYFMPPYVITPEELGTLARIATSTSTPRSTSSTGSSASSPNGALPSVRPSWSRVSTCRRSPGCAPPTPI
jgi:adenosylmethionine-8-amino-7-oxononanoate aminotransferase